MASTAPIGAPGPLLGTIWWVLSVSIVAFVASYIDANAYHLLLGYRSAIAFMGYLIMQVKSEYKKNCTLSFDFHP